jgi:hypothetical protein
VYLGVVSMLGYLVPVRHGVDERIVFHAHHDGWLTRLLRALFPRH